MPPLNAADQQRLECPPPAGLAAQLDGLPGYRFLANSLGEVVQTPDGETWVSFSSANAREAQLLRNQQPGERAHFECWDDLNWASDLLTNPDLVEGIE